jgi:hypothetical protein
MKNNYVGFFHTWAELCVSNTNNLNTWWRYVISEALLRKMHILHMMWVLEV